MAGPQFAKWIRSGVVNNFIDHLFTVHFIYCIEKTETKLCGFICAYHPAALGSNPKHTIYTFFNLYYWNCDEKRTKINKKRPGLAHFKKEDANDWFLQNVSLVHFGSSLFIGSGSRAPTKYVRRENLRTGEISHQRTGKNDLRLITFLQQIKTFLEVRLAVGYAYDMC